GCSVSSPYCPLPDRIPFGAYVRSSSPILDASILIAPVPYFSTQSATDSLRPVSASINGFLTTMIGSWLGFSEVPHPSHLRASSVAGAVICVVLGERIPSP